MQHSMHAVKHLQNSNSVIFQIVETCQYLISEMIY